MCLSLWSFWCLMGDEICVSCLLCFVWCLVSHICFLLYVWCGVSCLVPWGIMSAALCLFVHCWVSHVHHVIQSCLKLSFVSFVLLDVSCLVSYR